MLGVTGKKRAVAGPAQRQADGQPYDGRVFSAWMLGVALVMGNAALLFVMRPGVILPAWLAIIVSWCIWRTRRRILIGLVGGVLMLWPWVVFRLVF